MGVTGRGMRTTKHSWGAHLFIPDDGKHFFLGLHSNKHHVVPLYRNTQIDCDGLTDLCRKHMPDWAA